MVRFRAPRVRAEAVLLSIITAVVGGLAIWLGLAREVRTWVLVALVAAGVTGACAVAEWSRHKRR